MRKPQRPGRRLLLVPRFEPQPLSSESRTCLHHSTTTTFPVDVKAVSNASDATPESWLNTKPIELNIFFCRHVRHSGEVRHVQAKIRWPRFPFVWVDVCSVNNGKKKTSFSSVKGIVLRKCFSGLFQWVGFCCVLFVCFRCFLLLFFLVFLLLLLFVFCLLGGWGGGLICFVLFVGGGRGGWICFVCWGGGGGGLDLFYLFVGGGGGVCFFFCFFFFSSFFFFGGGGSFVLFVFPILFFTDFLLPGQAVCACALGGWGVGERENSNSKTLFYKDCSLGSVKNLS